MADIDPTRSPMGDAIEFVRDGHKLRLVVSKVLDPRYWVVNEVRLANPEDLRTAGYVSAKLYAEENAADPEGYMRATIDNFQREWGRMIRERDAALQRVRELEEQGKEARNLYDQRSNEYRQAIVEAENERDDLRQKLEEAEKKPDYLDKQRLEKLEKQIDRLRARLGCPVGYWAEHVVDSAISAENERCELVKKLTAAEQRAEAAEKLKEYEREFREDAESRAEEAEKVLTEVAELIGARFLEIIQGFRK